MRHHAMAADRRFLVDPSTTSSRACAARPRCRRMVPAATRRGEADGALLVSPGPPADAPAPESRCPVLRAAQVLPRNPRYPWSDVLGVLDLLFEPAHQTYKKKLQGRAMVQDRVLSTSTYMLGSKDLCKQVLSDSDAFEVFWPAAVPTLLGSESVTLLAGQPHTRLRSLLQPFFKPAAILQYIPDAEQLASSFLAEGADACSAAGAAQPLTELLSRFTFEFISRVVMGFQLEQEVHDQLRGHTSSLTAALFLPMVDLPFSPFAKAKHARAEIQRVVRERMAVVWAELAAGRRPPGLLTDMLEAKDEEGNGLSDAQITDNFITLLFAGTDTTASVLTTLCYHLMKQPALMAALVVEQEALQAKHGPALTKQALQDMAFGEQCICEALRWRHPVGGVFRKATRDTQLGGVLLEQGEAVAIPLAHNVWKQGAWEKETCDLSLDAFNPHRFGATARQAAPEASGSSSSGSGGNTEAASGSSRAGASAGWESPLQTGFGSGAHTCIGAALSVMEMKVLLAVVARRYRLRLAQDCMWVGPIPHLANGCLAWIERV